MPFNWVAAFKIIPWSEVIAVAPTVARTARDLWRGMNKSDPSAPETHGAAANDAPVTVEEELNTLRAELAQTRAQLLSTSDILRTLAEQDEKLVAAIEVLRARTRILAIVCAALVVLCALLLLLR
jgi:septal ring factor EnvC (AmiA/AmiB activator)